MLMIVLIVEIKGREQKKIDFQNAFQNWRTKNKKSESKICGCIQIFNSTLGMFVKGRNQKKKKKSI